MNKIKSITEAYSMQPTKWIVGMNYFNDRIIIDKIELEKIKIFDEPKMMYIGYTMDGKKAFQYLANSVNVEYFIG